MSRIKSLSPIFLIIIFLVLACSPSVPATHQAVQTVLPTTTPLPTPASPNDSIVWGNLQVTMDGLEITNEYITDFGSTRTPPADKKFLWVHVQLKNISRVAMDVPVFEHYSILYAAIELKPTYGHRDGYVDYTTLDTTIFPNQELDGWLRFDIPNTAGLKDMRFVFIPESVQVGTSYSSPGYPYAEDKPTYVWDCGK